MPQLDSLLQIRIDDHIVCHRDMVQKEYPQPPPPMVASTSEGEALDLHH